jgi:hypothetical protein
MNEDIENCYRFYIITSSLKTKLARESQIIIIQLWKPKWVGKTFKKSSKSWLMFWLMGTVDAPSP